MVLVRPVTEADASQIVALLNRIIAEGVSTVMDEELTLADQQAFLRGFPSRGTFHAAVNSHAGILGIQDIVPLAGGRAFAHIGEISTFVRQDVQGKGIGRALCAATFAAARRNGFEKVMATVRADNARAVAFYRGQGFRLIGTLERHARIRGRDFDEVLLERFL
jgi:L-amino acid N-acyltransferase YncA